ncbi:MAG: hypothetical protein M3P26_12950 [Gemmatimonadota bacterium]|nr:hypothetical protein [Gemmatimonadota bacterium]
MRSTVLCLTLLVSVAACETSTDPFIGFGGSGGITVAQVTGNWSFTVHPTSALACSSGSLADGQVLTAHLDVLAGGTLSSGTSFWQGPSSTTLFPLSGSVNLSNGITALILAASSGSAMDLAGTMTSAGSFSGTLGDPRAGFLPVFAACSYTTTGSKTS